VPTMKWLDSIPPIAPVIKGTMTASGLLLQWSHLNPDHGKMRYVVYQFTPGKKLDLNDATAILAITDNEQYVIAKGELDNRYVVTAIDRLWNESAGSNVLGGLR
ncbi:MAG: hypothetical protein ABI169_05455, partial [Chitinophagaceae bacterium]